jgi:hypothetical protein
VVVKEREKNQKERREKLRMKDKHGKRELI